MAGFGFSPTDIVEVGKFSAKIIAALKEEGGSKAEYQDAVWSCGALQQVLQEINAFHSENIPAHILDQLKEQSTHMQRFIADYLKTIQKYEKAMGKGSCKCAKRGALRKAKWALSAAQDLNKFRLSIATQLDVLKLLIAKQILISVTQTQPPRQSNSSEHDRQLAKHLTEFSSQQMSVLYEIRNEVRYLSEMNDSRLYSKLNELTNNVTSSLLSGQGATSVFASPRPQDSPLLVEYPVQPRANQNTAIASSGHQEQSAGGQLIPYAGNSKPMVCCGDESQPVSQADQGLNELLRSLDRSTAPLDESIKLPEYVGGAKEQTRRLTSTFLKTPRGGSDDPKGKKRPASRWRVKLWSENRILERSELGSVRYPIRRLLLRL